MENSISTSIFEKILAVQSALKPITKDSPNPFFKSNYFDINAVIAVIKPLLSENGLIVLQPLSEINGLPAIETHIIEASTGKQMGFKTPLINNQDPQKLGSVITYTRRYALVSLFLIEGEEDDDGNAGAGKTDPKTPKMVPLDEDPFSTGKTCSDCGKVVTGNFKKCYACNTKK